MEYRNFWRLHLSYSFTDGNLPDGRAAFTPFAPGANPSYGAEQNGLLASLNSVAKLPYHWALDGISNTQTINPDALGHSEGERVNNLVQVMDGYFDQGAHHLNVNVFGTEKLLDAMEHPEKEEYAIKGVSLEIPKNKTTVLIGPSGSGKTTLLRCINLLEIPDRSTASSEVIAVF